MDTTLKLYQFDGQDDIPFPYNGGGYIGEQAELLDFTVNKTRMGAAPTITGTLEYPVCLDSVWEANGHFDDVFVVFNGEKYYLKATPTSSKSNDKKFYKHELTFVSERSVLETVYMIDDNENQTSDILYSNNTQYTFFGNIHDFAERINQSMYFSKIGDSCMYSGTPPVIVPVSSRVLVGDGYYVVVDSSVTITDEVLITLNNNTVSDALKQIFEQFGVPYYFVGKVIHIGNYEPISETVPTYADSSGVLGAGLNSGALVPYEYGQPNAVLNVSRNNGTKQIYNRCSGTGSEDNIPYYYPNPTPSGTIHHKTTAQSGSTLTDSAVIITDQLKFSNLGDGDALVYSYANGDATYHLFVKGVYISDFLNGVSTNEIPIQNGTNFLINFPFDDFGSGGIEYYGVTKQITVEFSITEEYSIVGLNFGSEFQTNTRFEVLNPNGIVIRTGNGRYVSLPKQIFIDDEGEYLFGTYKLKLYKEYEPSSPSQSQGWFDLNSLWSDINADNPYRWFGSIAQGTFGWRLQSTNNMVYLSKYGISITQGTVLKQGDKIEKIIDKWVMPQTKLMPSCYRESDGKKRFYPARNYPFSSSEDYDADLGDEVSGGNVNNDFYKDESDNYYSFVNQYRRLKQREHIYDLPDIKPSIKGMENDDNMRVDMFEAFQYDLNDDNSGYFDENGNWHYNHPYFFALMRPTDSFNLFAQAIDEAEMTISMTNGHCAPCEFKIAVDKDTQKNLVQVNTEGSFTGYDALLRDEEGDVICGRKYAVNPQDFQQDTTTSWVWIALEKDINTFGGENIMPYNKDGVTIRPNACTDLDQNNGDTFVILHINMPQAYIEAAEEQLTKEIIKSMYDDNSEKFNMSLKYSRVYLGENQGLVGLLNENVKVSAKYNNITKQYFVSSYTYAMKSTSPIPEITINGLVETVEELKSVSSSGKGFVKRVSESISENFGELMMGFNKPFTRIINQNNTQVTNQIKGEFPTNYVSTDAELFVQNLVVGAGGRRVNYFKNGTNGQVLKMKNGLLAWDNIKESVIGSVTKQLSSSFAILSTTSTISSLTNTIEENGKYLIVAQIQVETSSEGSARNGFVIAQIVNSTPKPTVLLASGKAYISLSGQVIVCAVADLEKEDVIHIDIEANSSSLYNVVPSTTGNSTYTKCTSVQYIRIM